jgi:hypothetical protein
MTSIDAAKLDGMMRKIKQMLALADHPNTPEHEADLARANAERLMQKYRIEESELIESGALAGEAVTPGVQDVHVAPWGSEFYNTYWTMLHYIAEHCGVRMAQTTSAYLDGVSYLTATMVGYEADLRYADVLFTNAKILFGERMEPKPLDSMSDEDNVYRMRSAGMERIRIARLLGYGDTTSATAKVTRLYKKACEARGEHAVLTGKGNSVTAFREAYSLGFVNELFNRLYSARNAVESDSKALVLVGRKEAVDEAFYERFPNLRPIPQNRAIGENNKSKRARQYRATAAEMRRWERLSGPMGQAGNAAGRKAASEVSINKATPTRRLES